jgi:hypothetical protein
VEGSNYWFTVTDGEGTKLLKYEDGTPEVTVQDVMYAEANTIMGRRTCMIHDPYVTWTHETSGIAFQDTPTAASATYTYTVKTVDGGDDWALIYNNIIMSDALMLATGDHRHLISTAGTAAFVYDPSLKNLRVVKTPAWTGYTTYMNLAGDYLFCSNGTTTLVFYHGPAPISYIRTCRIQSNVVLGPDFVTTCQFTMKASDESLYEEGQVIELYDGFDTLAFAGKITSKRLTRGRCEIVALGHDRELNVVSNNTLGGGAVTVASRFTAMVATRNWLYTSSSVDPDASFDGLTFNAAATVDSCSGWHVAWLTRAGERAIVYVEPDGKTWAERFEDLAATGLRVKSDIGQWRLDRDASMYEVVDTRCTRASCVYTGKTRYTYSDGSGMAAIEATEGVTEAAAIIEPNIAVEASADNYAINAWTTFSTSTTFLHLIARNQGYIQPGQTVEVSWNQGEVVLAKTKMCVLGWDWDARNDVMMLTLGTGIATPHEMDALELDCDGKHEPA